MTPHELNIKIKYYELRRDDKDKDIITLTWYSAYFNRIKKLEKLEDFIRKIKRKKPSPNRVKDDKELHEIAQNKGVKLPNK